MTTNTTTKYKVQPTKAEKQRALTVAICYNKGSSIVAIAGYMGISKDEVQALLEAHNEKAWDKIGV